MPVAEVQRIQEVEWRVLREVRLRALADSPDAFGSTLERESAFSDADWQEWARDATSGQAESCYLGWSEGEPVGIVGAYVEDGCDHVHLIAMWVTPEARRSGVGHALLDAVMTWAAEIGALAVRLDVADDNAEARQLYETSGFSPTGRARRYENRPQLGTIELTRPTR